METWVDTSELFSLVCYFTPWSAAREKAGRVRVRILEDLLHCDTRACRSSKLVNCALTLHRVGHLLSHVLTDCFLSCFTDV